MESFTMLYSNGIVVYSRGTRVVLDAPPLRRRLTIYPSVGSRRAFF
jgi:hypothetical protein